MAAARLRGAEAERRSLRQRLGARQRHGGGETAAESLPPASPPHAQITAAPASSATLAPKKSPASAVGWRMAWLTAPEFASWTCAMLAFTAAISSRSAQTSA